MITVNARLSSQFDRGSRRAKANEAGSLLSRAVNDARFRTGIFDTLFTDARWAGAQTPTSKLDANQIWNILSCGTEIGTKPDNTWDLDVVLYSPRWLWSSAIGYTEAGTIHTTFKFFDQESVEDIAAHWGHEWCHTAGFVHDFRNTAERGKSVPYAVGDLVSRILAAVAGPRAVAS